MAFRPVITIGFALIAFLGPTTVNAASLDILSGGYSTPTGAVLNTSVYGSPQGNYQAFTNSGNLALNASVSVSGTIAGYPTIHNANFLTDGYYGNGSSWIEGGSSPSWVILDLGSLNNFDTFAFGRDRLVDGVFYNDRDPGPFQISVSSDGTNYSEIFDSDTFLFSGALGLDQTLQANFDNVNGRYVRLDVGMLGRAAIDEIEIMNLSPVPVPAAIWLFGTALVGLIGIGKRIRVT